MKDVMQEMKGKKVFLVTKAARRYSGTVKEVTDNFIFLIDHKFGEKVVINFSEISSIEEEK